MKEPPTYSDCRGLTRNDIAPDRDAGRLAIVNNDVLARDLLAALRRAGHQARVGSSAESFEFVLSLAPRRSQEPPLGQDFFPLGFDDRRFAPLVATAEGRKAVVAALQEGR